MNKEIQFKKEFIDLYSELDLNSLLDQMATKICGYLDCEAASMFLYDSKKEELYFEIATGAQQEELKKIVLKKGEGLVGWVAENNKSATVNDCANDSRFTAVTDKQTKFVTHSLVAVPVLIGGKFLGVLEVVNKAQGTFNHEDQQLLESIAHFIAIPLQNALLFKKITMETQEKERLIELGKIVSLSFDINEVFSTLKNIFNEIIDPLEISVRVHSQEKTYSLISNSNNHATHNHSEGATPLIQKDDTKKLSHLTTIKASQKSKKFKDYSTEVKTTFSLQVKNQELGYMEIVTQKKLPDEVISLIRGIAIFTAISIEKFEMHLQVLEREKIEQELHIAKKIQQSFLPNEKNIPFKGMDVSCLNIPSSVVGGDYYDIVQLSDHETIFTINDVTGHGVPASLLMSIFSANFKYQIKKEHKLLKTIYHLNNLIAETTDISQSVTSFSCFININEMNLKYINCGHHPSFIFRGSEIIELKEGETALGWFLDIPRTIHQIKIQKNDLIFLFTDGIIEAENAEKKSFDYIGIKNSVYPHMHLPAHLINEKLISNLKNYVDSDQFIDDVTFIIIKIL